MPINAAVPHPTRRRDTGTELPDVSAVCLTKALGEQNVQRASDDLGRGPAEDLFGALVEMHDPLRLIYRDDGVRGDGQNLREHRLRRLSLASAAVAFIGSSLEGRVTGRPGSSATSSRAVPTWPRWRGAW